MSSTSRKKVYLEVEEKVDEWDIKTGEEGGKWEHHRNKVHYIQV
jgi:hypothetical protein